MNMRHPFVLVILALVALIVPRVHADVATEPSEPRVTITAQNLPNPSSVTVGSLAARAVLKEFNRKYPQYDVRPFSMPTIEGQGMDSGPLMAIAAGIPPHVIYVNFRQSATYIGQGFLEPIEILLARAMSHDARHYTGDGKGNFQADPSPEQIADALAMIKAQVPTPAWPVAYREDESGRLKGQHVWALPLTNQVHALSYRKDLFYEAGLDPERPPQTWDEMLEYSRKLTKPEKGQFGMMFTTGKYISYSAYEFFGSNGVEAMRKDEQGKWYAAYGNREAAEAVYFVWQLIAEKWRPEGATEDMAGTAYTQSGRQATIDWNRGKIAMQWHSLQEELISQVNPQVVGIAPVPAPALTGRRGAGIINAQMFGVFSDATPEQKIAAVRYAWFTTSKDAKRIRTKVYVEGGYGKYVAPNLLKEFGYDRLLKQVPEGWQKVFNEAIESGVPEPYGRNTQNIYDHLDRPIHTSVELLSKSVKEGGWLELTKEEKLDRIEAVLRASAKDVDESVLGKLPESVVKRRNNWAAVVLAFVGICFAWGMFHVWRHFTRLAKQTNENRHFSRYAWGYVIILPGLLLTALWSYIPLLGGLGIAFVDYQLIRDSQWVGLANFATIIHDPRFWDAFARTFYFVALTIGLGFWPPILLAIMLQEIPTDTAKYFYRTVYYLPAVLSGLVVMFLWKNMYGPTKAGVLNQIILSVNILGPVSATIVKLLLLGVWGLLIALLIYLPIKVDEMGTWLKVTLWTVATAFIAVTLLPVASAYDSSITLFILLVTGLLVTGVGLVVIPAVFHFVFRREIVLTRFQFFVRGFAILLVVVMTWLLLRSSLPQDRPLHAVPIVMTFALLILTVAFKVQISGPGRLAGAREIAPRLLMVATIVGALLLLLRINNPEGFVAALKVLASLVGTFNLEPFRWLRNPEAAMACVVVPTIWAASGPGCILYLAALKTVPDDLYEAADIDGASNWHKVFYIVLPRLKYLIVIQFVGAVQGSFKGGVEYIMAMTGGGPNDATNILAVEIFSQVFMNLNYGLGTAAAWILGAVIIGFTAYQLKLLANAEFKATG